MTATRGSSAVQVVPWVTIDLLRPFFDKGPDPVAARLLDFPMLRGAWAGSVASGGNWHDISGHGNHLVYNGNPTFNYDGLVPYWDLDGVGDHLDITDAASGNDFDIIGTEAYVASAARGLTLGGWFWFDAHVASSEMCMTKWLTGAVNDIAYALYEAAATNNLYFAIGNGVGFQSVPSTLGLTTSQWHCCIGRFDPGAEIAVFQNGTKFTNVAGIYAALMNNAADFTVGAIHNGFFPMNGRASMPFVCAAALSDTQINVFYHMTKRYFGH